MFVDDLKSYTTSNQDMLAAHLKSHPLNQSVLTHIFKTHYLSKITSFLLITALDRGKPHHDDDRDDDHDDHLIVEEFADDHDDNEQGGGGPQLISPSSSSPCSPLSSSLPPLSSPQRTSSQTISSYTSTPHMVNLTFHWDCLSELKKSKILTLLGPHCDDDIDHYEGCDIDDGFHRRTPRPSCLGQGHCQKKWISQPWTTT